MGVNAFIDSAGVDDPALIAVAVRLAGDVDELPADSSNVPRLMTELRHVLAAMREGSKDPDADPFEKFEREIAGL